MFRITLTYYARGTVFSSCPALLEPCGFAVRLREWASGYACIHMTLKPLLCTGEWLVNHKPTIWPQWPTRSPHRCSYMLVEMQPPICRPEPSELSLLGQPFIMLTGRPMLQEKLIRRTSVPGARCSCFLCNEVSTADHVASPLATGSHTWL